MEVKCLFLALFCQFIFSATCQGLPPVSGFRPFSPQSFVDPRRQLSPTQQGHILSDIQQHQHRFAQYNNLLQQQQTQQQRQSLQQQPQPQQQRQLLQQPVGPGQAVSFVQEPSIPVAFPNQANILPVSQIHQRAPTQQFGQPNVINPQQNNQFLINQPSQNSYQAVLPNGRIVEQQNSVHQHHTQTGFTPNFVQQQQVPQRQSFQQPQQQIPVLNQQLPVTNQQIPVTNQFQQQQLNSQINQVAFPQSVNTQKAVFNSQLLPHPNAAPIFTPDQSVQLQNYFENQRQQERARELREKQLIIQKHEQFVAKQHQKQLQKVQQLHQEFIEKQQKKQVPVFQQQQQVRPLQQYQQQFGQPKSRPLLPFEAPLFQQALKTYDELHPTTPKPTKPTTTAPPTTTTSKPATRVRSRTAKPKQVTPRIETEDPELFLQGQRQKLYSQLKQTIAQETERPPRHQASGNAGEKKQKQPKLYERDDLLRQLKLAIGDNPTNDKSLPNGEPMEITLPNGQTVQVIRTTDPNLVPGAVPLNVDSSTLSKSVSLAPVASSTTLKPPRAIFEELTKGVLPPGADFEVIRQTDNGKLEELGKIPQNLQNEKKVTFVVLEEREDGSYKVQGVRGNGDDKQKTSGAEYESILKRIKEGDIKLPPSSKPSETPSTSIFTERDAVTPSTVFSRSTKIDTLYRNSVTNTAETDIVPSVTIIPSTHSASSTTRFISNDYTHSTKPIFQVTSPGASPTTPASVVVNTFSQNNKLFLPTIQSKEDLSPYSTVATVQAPQFTQHPVSPGYVNSIGISTTGTPTQDGGSVTSAPPTTFHPTTPHSIRSTTARYVTQDIPNTASHLPELTDIFRQEGLYAMAKYLKQSGLDTILNETGPYTVFVPTDKAFKNLLVQLGGPEKAEDKFKSNPRLLSGLLLHHVIPGAFEIDTLQDEMTGVSLAGTQLRVNQYAMHDAEWNDVKVTTINGAKILTDKLDIGIPQGIAHAIDRVMFPLPVGDILQTLQSDRERRFTNFLRAVYASELADTFTGSKTFTVFAPTDAAFDTLTSEELQQAVTDKESARALVTRHVTPGTLFSAGMRYYQQKDSMATGKLITIQKNGGRIKVNNAHIVTNNIPATNGVIHAVDNLL